MANPTNELCPSIPKRELEALARCLLPAIQEYFESKHQGAERGSAAYRPPGDGSAGS